MTPHEAYPDVTKQEVIAWCKANGWKIIGFRVPRPEEYYLNHHQIAGLLVCRNVFLITNERIILKSINEV